MPFGPAEEGQECACNHRPNGVVRSPRAGATRRTVPGRRYERRRSPCPPSACRRLPVPIRGPIARLLLGAGLVCAGALAGAVAACLAAGVARETAPTGGASAVDAAVQAAGWTVGALLVLA